MAVIYSPETGGIKNAMHPILCIYLCWYIWQRSHSEETVRHNSGFSGTAHEKDSMKWMWYWDERYKECIGSFSSQIPSFFFICKRRDKSIGCLSVWEPDREQRLWRDDECMILHTSEHLSDRGKKTDRRRMNDIRMHTLEQRTHIGTHSFCWALNVACVCLCVCPFYLLRKPFPQMQASEAVIGIKNSLPIPSINVYIWVLCVSAYLLPMKC